VPPGDRRHLLAAGELAAAIQESVPHPQKRCGHSKFEQQMLSTSTPLFATAFALSSILMILANKGAVACTASPCLLLALQNSVTVLIAFISTTSSKSLNVAHAAHWTPCTLLFAMNMYSSMKAMQTLSVASFTTIRNLQPCLSAAVDYVQFGKTLSGIEFCSLFLIIMSCAAFYGSDVTYDLWGYLWTCMHMASMTAYLTGVKILSERLDLDAGVMSIYNNLGSLPLLLVMALLVAKEDSAMVAVLGALKAAYRSPMLAFAHMATSGCLQVILLSCIGGFCLSVSAFNAQKRLSVTSFTVLNTVSKLPAIVFGKFLYGGKINLTMLLGIFVAFGAGLMYTLSKQGNLKWEKQTNWQVPKIKFVRLGIGVCMFFTIIIQFVTQSTESRYKILYPAKKEYITPALKEHIPRCVALNWTSACVYNDQVYTCARVKLNDSGAIENVLPINACLPSLSMTTCNPENILCSCSYLQERGGVKHANCSLIEPKNSVQSTELLLEDTNQALSDCWLKESSWCMSDNKKFTCTRVPEKLQNNRHASAPHLACLPGAFSWSVCQGGAFMCECHEDEHDHLNWTVPCSSWTRDPSLSNRDLLLDQFARSDYRLGNILDRWFAVHICQVLERCDANLEKKIESELDDMTTRAPKGSIAKFLMRNSPGPRKIPVKFFQSFNQTKFAQTYSWFWIYSYDAVGEVLDTFRISLSHNLQQYGEMTRAPWYFKPVYLDVNTCVIHYRLGDMLSHGHFLDPVDFSRQLHQWAVLEGLNILTFQVLSSGGISFRGSGSEVSQSRTLLDIFLNTTQQLFPEADILTYDQGTPDEDWMRMVMSPMLFTSHCSYAISTAALSIGRRGTPAIENSNFPGCGSRASGYLVPGWYLFPCKNFDASSYPFSLSGSDETKRKQIR